MLNDSALILAAGMQRSASTWLYNAARLLLTSSPSVAEQFSCGWIGDWKQIPKKNYMLIKVHDFNKSFADQSKCILYSFRDIRDVLASGIRKFGWIPSLEAADNIIIQHEQWMNVADLVMRYETMLQDKENIITDLARLFDIKNVDPAGIANSIEQLNYQSQGDKNEMYHKTNLYHSGHITDGRHGSWKGLIDLDLIQKIEEKHQGWFKKYNYPVNQL
jgi:hypothetical protein